MTHDDPLTLVEMVPSRGSTWLSMLLKTLRESSQIHTVIYQYTCCIQVWNLSSTHQLEMVMSTNLTKVTELGANEAPLASVLWFIAVIYKGTNITYRTAVAIFVIKKQHIFVRYVCALQNILKVFHLVTPTRIDLLNQHLVQTTYLSTNHTDTSKTVKKLFLNRHRTLTIFTK
jgi:hypothetical protein